MNGKSYLLAALALCGLITMTGCDLGMLPPNIRYVEDLAKIEADRLEKHDKNMTEQHKIQTPEVAAELDAQRALFTEQIAKLDEELAAARKKQDEAWQYIIDNGMNIATTVAELAGVPSTVTNMVRDKLQPKIDGAKDEAATAMNEAMLVRASVDNVEKVLARLSEDTRDKFASVTQDTLDRLSALRTDDAEFRRVLKEEVKLTPAEMAALKDMTPEQIMALLLSAGGAAVAGGALGKTGKSRGQADLDDLKEKLSELKGGVS